LLKYRKLMEEINGLGYFQWRQWLLDRWCLLRLVFWLIQLGIILTFGEHGLVAYKLFNTPRAFSTGWFLSQHKRG
jgi:hypothetical protein